MKLNFAVFKKGKPFVWIIGALVLFVIFYMFINRGGSSGGVVVQNSGPSDAAINASAALTAKQSDNSAQVAIATLAYNGQVAQTQAQADIAKYVAGLDAATQSKYLDTQIALAAFDLQGGIAQAQIAANVTHDINLTQMQMFHDQMAANASMFDTQMKAATFSVLAGTIGTLKANDRDNAFALLTSNISGQDITYLDKSSGSFSTGTRPSPTAPGSGGGSGVPFVPISGLIGGFI